jgi:CDP-diacylglycerol--glycerol-3-phosphate 3-phosphatidyltransferase
MTVPHSLRGQWWLTAVVFTLAAVGVCAAATAQFSAAVAGMWALAAALPLGYALWLLRRSLALNGPPSGSLRADGGTRVYATLGLANGLTLTRGWLYAAVGGFLLVVPPVDSAWRVLPALWYGTGAALDWIDGFVATRFDRRTELGARLDLAFDTMGFLVAPLVAVVWGQLPVWYLSLSAARYVYRAACWARRYRGLPVADLPESRVRRPLAGLQMAFIALALAPATSPALVATVAPVPLVASLAVFCRDYLVVAGHLRRGQAS